MNINEPKPTSLIRLQPHSRQPKYTPLENNLILNNSKCANYSKQMSGGIKKRSTSAAKSTSTSAWMLGPKPVVVGGEEKVGPRATVPTDTLSVFLIKKN